MKLFLIVACVLLVSGCAAAKLGADIVKTRYGVDIEGVVDGKTMDAFSAYCRTDGANVADRQRRVGEYNAILSERGTPYRIVAQDCVAPFDGESDF